MTVSPSVVYDYCDTNKKEYSFYKINIINITKEIIMLLKTAFKGVLSLQFDY